MFRANDNSKYIILSLSSTISRCSAQSWDVCLNSRSWVCARTILRCPNHELGPNIYSDKWWVTVSRRGLLVLVWSQLAVPTPKINQSSWDPSGYSSGLVSLSLRLVVTWYRLSVRGLWLVLVDSHLVMEKNTLTSSQQGILLQTCTTSCRGSVTNTNFSCSFFWILIPNPRLFKLTLKS